MEHFKARTGMGGEVFAWRLSNSHVCYRFKWLLGFGPVETYDIPYDYRDLSIPELMDLDWHLEGTPVRAS